MAAEKPRAAKAGVFTKYKWDPLGPEPEPFKMLLDLFFLKRKIHLTGVLSAFERALQRSEPSERKVAIAQCSPIALVPTQSSHPSSAAVPGPTSNPVLFGVSASREKSSPQASGFRA